MYSSLKKLPRSGEQFFRGKIAAKRRIFFWMDFFKGTLKSLKKTLVGGAAAAAGSVYRTVRPHLLRKELRLTSIFRAMS